MQLSFFILFIIVALVYVDATTPYLRSLTFTSPPKRVVPLDSDVGKDMIQIVQIRGYSIETHYVTTSDGYILTLFRIPCGKSGSKRGKSPPVILQHGLLDSSYTWVNNFEDQSLGYILADNGYDVWFGNNRGNRYGRNHTTLNPDDGTPEFWSFTWDDMALYDVPAIIEYVVNATQSRSVSWVGHSEGTIQMFAAGCSTERHPQLKKMLAKVNLFVALAPVAYVNHLVSPALRALADTRMADMLMRKGHYEFLPYGKVDDFAPVICRYGQNLCDNFLDDICGPSTNLNETRYQVYVSETPAGTSTLNMDHWMQGVNIDKFQSYDYGNPIQNQRKYGQSTPPAYDLSRFVLKVALFSGLNDYLADPIDVDRLVSELPSDSVVFHDIQSSYAHLDYTWAFNANKMIYPQVLNLLKEYTK